MAAKTIIYSFLLTGVLVFCDEIVPDPEKSISWGPGLRPSQITLPARYFFVQLVDNGGKNITEPPTGSLDIHIGHPDKKVRCRVWSNILNRNDGSYIVRYKVYQVCDEMMIDLRYNNFPIAGFPLTISQKVYPDECACPLEVSSWKENMNCPASFKQISKDLKQFSSVNMDIARGKIIKKFNKHGSVSLCHYVILNNQIYRKCHGQYVGFHVFMDAILLSLARKVKLADNEIFVNLGDWPLEQLGPQPLPIFSWCGSDKTADIVMPTYDITESTLECMGRVQLDMLSVQGNNGPIWSQKKPIAFWRGRDSRQERLDLVDIARKHPDLFNVSLTNFFFFRDKVEEYGPVQPHVSFFEFFEYKYQICIDGSVAAYRFPYLLAGGGLVFKQDSQYYEHFYHDLVPGEHYLPVLSNLSNLVEKLNWALENDVDGQRIARNGAEYARDHLMPADIFCYHLILLEEWSKKLTSTIKVLPDMEMVPQPQTSEKCECPLRHEEL